MRSRCCLCVCARPRACVYAPLSLLGNGSVKIPFIVARQRLVKNVPIVARQRLGINVITVSNTHETIEELLDASFSMWPRVISRKAGD
jgi:hypothetical protein